MQYPNDLSDPAPGACRAERETLDAFHAQSLRALDRLLGLSRQLTASHADAPARQLAAELVQHFSMQARLHHEEEELNAFPELVAGGDPAVLQLVARLRRDHEQIARDWHEIEPHLDAVAAGQHWYDIDVISEGAEVFGALIQEHFALEDTLLRMRDGSIAEHRSAG